MQNLVEYFKEIKDIPFSKLEFNELDAAIFSRLSYINFGKIVSPYKYKKEKLCEISMELLSNETEKAFRLKNDRELIDLIRASIRYKDIYIKGYIKDTDIKITKQFSATTFMYLGKEISNFLLISFRGTDGSYVGWKEDFEMCYKDIIPAQTAASNYLKKMSRFSSIKTIYITGHSKGGNLGIYAASTLRSNVRNNIKSIFCFDSPGFSADFLKNGKYKSIESKILHYAPQSSVIGRLLYNTYKSIIIDSTKTLLYEHNIYNWKIENNQFVRAKSFSFISNKLDYHIKSSLADLTTEQKKKFVDELFEIIKELSVDGDINFGESLINFGKKIFLTFKTKSKATQDFIKSVLLKEKINDEVKFVKPIPNERNLIQRFFGSFEVDKKVANDDVVLDVADDRTILDYVDKK